jgi:hypothetical protein
VPVSTSMAPARIRTYRSCGFRLQPLPLRKHPVP